MACMGSAQEAVDQSGNFVSQADENSVTNRPAGPVAAPYGPDERLEHAGNL